MAGISRASILLLAATLPAAAQTAVVTVDPGERHQTLRGWEAVARVGGFERGEIEPLLPEIVARADRELGIDRLRAEFSGGVGGAGWQELDWTVEKIVLPLRERLKSRGERLRFSVAYRGSLPADPEEYGRLVVSVQSHLRDDFGIAPDTWEVVLSPDRGDGDVPRCSPELLAATMAATGSMLAEARLEPRFAAPSTSSPSAALPYLDEIARAPDALGHLAEVSYHLYGDPALWDAGRAALAARAGKLGLPLSMLERPGLDPRVLVGEWAVSGASVAAQFLLAGPAFDDGGHHFLVDPGAAEGAKVSLGFRSRLLAPYFLSARQGAVRIGARSDDPRVSPVAVLCPSGKVAVLLALDAASPPTLAIQGLPAGSYEGWFVKEGIEGTLPAVSIQDGEAVRFGNPGPGVLAVRPPAEPEPSANLLAHPGFEEEGPTWADVGIPGRRDFLRTQGSSQKRTGSCSLEVNMDQRFKGERLGATQIVPVVPGRTYRFTGWARPYDLDGEGASAYLEWLAWDGATSPAAWRVIERSLAGRIAGDGGWSSLGPFAQAAPAGAGAVRVELSVAREPDRPTNKSPGIAWFDDVELVDTGR